MAYDLQEARAPDVVAWTTSFGTEEWWRTHPDVIDVVSIPGTDADGTPGFNLQFWLRSAPNDTTNDTVRPVRTWRPTREPDLELCAEGPPPDFDFPGGLPEAEHTDFFVDRADECFPTGWWLVRVWIRRGRLN